MVLKRTEMFILNPKRTDVVGVGMLVSAAVLATGVKVAAASGVVVIALGTSPSSSGLLNANGTFVDTPLGYRYL